MQLIRPVLQPLERRTLLTALDPTWNPAGTYDQPYPLASSGSVEHSVTSMALVAGGKVLVVATHDATDSPRTSSLLRYNPDGSLDTTFGGGDGIIDLGEAAGAIAILKSGETVLVTAPDADHEFIEGRHADGSLDTSFGSGGKIPIALADPIDTRSSSFLAATPDGGFYFAETETRASDSDAPAGVDRLFKFTATGQPDTSFSTDGQLTIDAPATGFIKLAQIAADAQGRLLIQDESQLQRYRADGSFDTSFGDAGKVYTDTSISCFALQGDGKIVIAANDFNDRNVRLQRFNADGVQDIEYGDGRRAIAATPITDYGLAVVFLVIDSQSRATVVLDPEIPGEGNMQIVRQTADGSIDQTVAPGGFFDAGGLGTPTAVALQADDKLLIGGNSYHVVRIAEHGNDVSRSGHTVYVVGTDNADQISVALMDSNDRQVIVVMRNGTETHFNFEAGAGGVGGDADTIVSIDGKGGNDDIALLINFRSIIDAGSGDNHIIGSNNDDSIFAGDGNDIISAADGNDLVQAGAGNNDVVAPAGNDTVICGDGNDTVRIFKGTVQTAGGNDTIIGEGGALGVNSGLGDDSVTTADEMDIVYDDGGVNTIATGGGSDHVILSTEAATASTLDSGAGNDWIYLTGNYIAQAGDGNDFVTAVNLARLELGAGNDRARCGSDGDHPALVYGGDGDDTIFTGDGKDSIYGGAGRDRIYAGAGGDLISGGGGHDKLFGQLGRDRLYGGSGNDRLSAGGGDDRLTGHAGRDTLDGGAGTDRADSDALDRLLGIEFGMEL